MFKNTNDLFVVMMESRGMVALVAVAERNPAKPSLATTHLQIPKFPSHPPKLEAWNRLSQLIEDVPFRYAEYSKISGHSYMAAVD
jgi:hypothetical protein